MAEKQTCEECGADLPFNAPQGLCPRCLVGMAIRLSPQDPATIRVQPESQAGDRIGRYKLLQKIGEGGMGVVYMAEQEEPIRRRVALKIIKLGMDTRQVIARFEAERQALALMDHPNIAKVLDAGATDAGRPFFVMELVRGVPITEYCDKNHLPTRPRLDLFMQVCHAIQHAHQKGVIHRDLKPSNILVTLNDGVPLPMVIDFGIAKATNQKLTERTLFTNYATMIGTPAYMSPEQAEMSKLDVDTRTDIYALGVLLYELLTGTTPFPAKELLSLGYGEMQRVIAEREPLRPSTRLSTMANEERTVVAKNRSMEVSALDKLFRGDLDWIAIKCLEKDRTRRYDTANGLAMDIQRHLNDEPVVARPPSTAYRVQKLVRRNKLAFAAASAVAAVLVVGIGVSSWLFIRESKAHAQAVAAEREQSRLRQVAQTAQANEVGQRRRAEAGELSARQNLYAANMNVAQQAWEQRNVGRVRQVLEETATFPERGFEWYYWQRQTHLELKTLRGHIGLINSVAFSPDGQRIVTGSEDRTAKVWEAATGQELLTLRGHGSGIGSVAFSPDGKRIVTGSADQTVRTWEAVTGKPLLTIKAHGAYITSVAFSPDGQRIVSGSADKSAKVWDAASGKHLLTLEGHTGELASVAFSVDGQRIFTGSEDRTARVWEAGTGKQLLLFKGDSGNTGSVPFSPDGKRIVTGFGDLTAKVWDVASCKELFTLKGHSDAIGPVAFSRDGQRIVTGSSDQTAKVWDGANGDYLLTLNGHSGWIRSVAFSPDGQRIVTGSFDQTAKVWQVVSDKELLTLTGHSAEIRSVAVSPDGQRFVTGSGDRTAKLWEAAGGNELRTFTGHGGWIGSVAFSPDGRRIITGSGDRTAKTWEVASGKELFTLTGHRGWIGAVAFSSDGQRIVTGSFDQRAKVWEAASGKELLTLEGQNAAIVAAAFSPDGQRIVTGCVDNTAKVWETASGKVLFTLKGHIAAIHSVAFSPDGHWIVTGSDDQTAKMWEAASGKELLTLKGHSRGIGSVAFSPDSQRIVTGSRDKTAKVWEAVTAKELLTLKGHSGGIGSVAFSSDGQWIVTGSHDRTAKVWQAATARQVAAWQKEESDGKQHSDVLRQEQAAADERDRTLRAQDAGAIKQWLVLAPIPFADESGAAALAALEQEQIPQEANLRPRAGERVKVGRSERVWTPVQLQDYLIDFNDFLGEDTEWSVAYAVCYIQSEAHQTGLLLKVGSDDEAKIYLNGKPIHRRVEVQPFQPDQNVVTGVELKAGVNVMVFKVVNETSVWKGSVRITDVADQPVKGLRVTLTATGAEIEAAENPQRKTP